MKKFNSLKEIQATEDKTILNKIINILNSIAEIVPISEMNKFHEDFNNNLGGYVFLIENENDLKEIPVESTKNLYEYAGKFDAATKTVRYTILTNITNDAGGDIYFIPNSINNPNIEESYKLTAGSIFNEYFNR